MTENLAKYHALLIVRRQLEEKINEFGWLSRLLRDVRNREKEREFIPRVAEKD